MTNGPEPAYGQSTAWQPERPRFRLFPLLVSWFATGVALMVAAAILPGVDIGSFWGALLVAVIVAALNAVIPPVLAALRLPLTLVLGFLLVLIADALILQLAAELNVTDGVLTVDNFGWALLAALIVAAVSVVLAVILGSDDTSTIRIAQTDRAPAGDHREHRRPRDRLPRDRRARAARAAPGDARRQRADHGPLAGRRHAPPGRVGDRPLLADRREPGRDPAGVERGHLGLPLGGEGDRDAHDVLGAARLRRDRAAPRRPASGCSPTAARAAETSSPARRRT